MGSVDYQHVHPSRYQRLGAFGSVVDTDRRGDSEPPCVVECAVGILDPLGDVLDCDQATEDSVVVHQGEFLDPVTVQDRHSLIQFGAHRRGDQRFGCHEIGDRFGILVCSAEADVAVGQDADKAPARLAYRHAADLVARHQLLRVVERGFGREADW